MRRHGFTLIEVMVVIVILRILAGLLLPAIGGAIGRAREAAVSAEIVSLGQALADFKATYGEYPPSRIVVSETGDYSAVTLGVNLVKLAPRSMAAIKRYWPRVQLNTGSTAGDAPTVNRNKLGSFYDFNGNDICDIKPYVLTGPECLVFFLGGIPQSAGGEWAMTGFAKNPANPFVSSTVTANRIVPRFEFDNGRLINNIMNPLGNDFPGYMDSMGPGDGTVIPFYVYFSSYSGSGYDPGDCDMQEKDDNGLFVLGAYSSGYSPTDPPAINGLKGTYFSVSPNPYSASAPVATDLSGNAVTAVKPRVWINAFSFQIISCGRDRMFGMGGQYVGSNVDNKLPFLDMSIPGNRNGYKADSYETVQENSQVTGQPVGSSLRSRESDNITNFSAGRLN